MKHDERYKQLFSNPLFVEKLLKSFVHEDFVRHLNFNKMTKLDKSFIDKKMKQRESDIIYKIFFKDKPIYLYLLIEFQSTVDKNMPLRFLRYILELTESYGRDINSKLYPAVFPLLLYNGEKSWTAKYNSRDLFEASIPNGYIPNFKYYPVIINKIDKKTLMGIHNAVSAIFLLENTSIEETHRAFDDLIILLKSASPNEMNSFKVWLNSLLYDRNIEVSDETLNKLDSPEEILPMFSNTLAKMEEVYTLKGLYRGIKEGKIEGILEGKLEGKLEGQIEKQREIALNLLKSNFGLENTAKITGLTIEELKDLEV